MDTIGIDVGGTTIKAALVGPDGQLTSVMRIPSKPSASQADGLVRTIGEIIESLSGTERPPVGIGVAGLVDGRLGIVRESPNFPQWHDVPLARELSAMWPGRVIALDNDANAAGIAEAEFGQARGSASFLFFTLGTGVGGAVVLDGALWRGASGFAGELGHINVVPDGRRCGCGARGCLEQYASLNGLSHAVREYSLELDDAETLAESPRLPEELAALARAGNRAALECFQQVGYYLGLAVGSLLNVLNVERVVLGGGVAENLALFQHTLAETVAQHTFPPIFSAVSIHKSDLGPDAGIIGAAALARRATRLGSSTLSDSKRLF